MCQIKKKKRGYPDYAVTTGKHDAQEIDQETALETLQNEETDRIPFTLTYHPQNLAIKNVILKNFNILRNDPETKHIFSLPPFISFKGDKNLGNLLVRGAFKFNNQPGTFTCKRTRCKTCPVISNTVKISGPNRSVKVTEHFTCISTNVFLHSVHNLHAMQENLHRRNKEDTSANTYETQNKTTQMCPNQSRAISIFLTTPTTT